MSYFFGFDQPYFTGHSATVPLGAVSKFDCVLNGRGYMIDLGFSEPYKFESIPMLRSMFLQDRGTTPIGEHSLNPDDYWRRSVDDWSAGAGQKVLDHSDSVGNRFFSSQGVDPWTAGSVTLLPDTKNVYASANTVLQLAVAGPYMYVLDADTLKFATDVTTPTLTATTVPPAGGDSALGGASSLASDGYTIWVSDNTRVHYSTRGGSTYSPYHTVDHVASLVRTTKGRLFTAAANVLYTHAGTAGAASATAYYTHPNPDWTWTDVAGGPASIYFAGFSGDKGRIYGATIMADGTNLDVPTVVASLPSGETPVAITTYLSSMLIGTNKGLRMAIMDANGGITLGGLIKMDHAPQCFEAQDRFVWFGWTNYAAAATGLGRVDLSVFNETVPAYATDLMATAQNAVTSVVTLQGRRVFAVAGHGLYAEQLTKVAQGTVDSGSLNFALADNKILVKALVAYERGGGSFTMAATVDHGDPILLGNPVITADGTGNAAVLGAPQLQGRSYNVIFTLFREADLLDAPVIDRWTLMVEPQPERRAQFTIPLLLHSQVTTRFNDIIYYEPSLERRIIFDLMQSRQIVPWQDREITYNVIVDNFTWTPYADVGANREQGAWDGTLVTNLKVVN